MDEARGLHLEDRFGVLAHHWRLAAWLAACCIVGLHLLGPSCARGEGGVPASFRVQTYVGNGLPNPVAPLSANLWPNAMCVADDGTIYFSSHSVIRRLVPEGMVETIAGSYPSTRKPFEEGPALLADFDVSGDIVVDPDGNVIVAVPFHSVVRKITSDGTVRTIAGRWNGFGYSGDGGPALSAELMRPIYLLLGPDGSLYLSDTARVRRIRSDGTIETFAGSGSAQYGGNGDGGPATSAVIPGPSGMAFDALGRLFIADNIQSRVRQVDTDGIITTVAGRTGGHGWTGDGGPAIDAEIGTPTDVAFDPGGNLLIADSGHGVVRLVDGDGIIHTIAGVGTRGFSGDSGPATQARLGEILDLEFDTLGNLYLLDGSEYRIRRIDRTGIITTIAGNGTNLFGGDGGPASQAAFYAPQNPLVAPNGDVYIADSGNCRIRRVDAAGIVTTFAGNGQSASAGDEGPALEASFAAVRLARAPDGTLYFIDNGPRIRRIDPVGIVHHVAGSNHAGFAGDGGPAAAALFKDADDLFYWGPGQRLYIVDSGNNRVRYIDAQGLIWTFAGNGQGASTGDGGPAVAAALNRPNGVFVTNSGVVYISEYNSCVVRRVGLDGVITRIAGGGGIGFGGDGGPATHARLSGPAGVYLDPYGYLYIGDQLNNRVRRVSPAGIITTVAGTGEEGYNGEDIPALDANLWVPETIAAGPDGVLLVAGQFAGQIWALVPELLVPVGFGPLRAEAIPGGTRLRWGSPSTLHVEFVVERSPVRGSAAWDPVARVRRTDTDPVESDVKWRAEDRGGDHVMFRVQVLGPEGDLVQLLGPIEVTVTDPFPSLAPRLSARPNPFNPRVTITFSIPTGRTLDLAVFDAAGRRVATLAEGHFAAGDHDVMWGGRDGRGESVASGVYYAELRADGRRLARMPLTLVR